jgi:hypothetical protein
MALLPGAQPAASAPASGQCGLSVEQDHVTLALASLPIGLRAMVADEGLSIGFREPVSLLAPSEPS